MADLENLVRLRRHTVEEKQKILGEILREVEKLEAQKADYMERLKTERAAFEENPMIETRDFYGLFEGVIRTNIERVNGEIAKLETRLQLAQEAVRAAFADMKRVEIVHKRRQAEERAEIDQKESIELDEIGLEVFRRNEEN